MNRGDLRQLLKDLLGTPLPPGVRGANETATDQNLDRYLNQAQRQVAIRVGYQSSGTITLATNTRTYALPAQCHMAQHVRFVRAANDEEPLNRVYNLADLPDDYRDATGEPEDWYMDGGQLAVRPIPSANENTKNLRVFGVFEPADMTGDNDVSPLDLAVHPAIASKAAVLILQAQADAEAQSSNPNFAADVVQQETRTRAYSERAKEMQRKYQSDLAAGTGPVFA